MRILIANDDGIYSPGILALAEVAAELGEVRIFAPDMEQSSMGHAVTHNRPLTVRRTSIAGFDAYRINGTPADCVAVGVVAWGGEVDVVLSGINLGTNLGNSMWHSGTLAAAKQAALMRLRGIAFSIPVGQDEPSFEGAKPWVARALRHVLPHPDLTLVNVNIPEEPTGIAWTRQSVRHYDGKVVPGADPMGRPHFWFTVSPMEETEEGTDRWAMERRLVSMTPLRLDLTDGDSLDRARARDPLG
jgi:5'-nucleotidase